MNWGTPTSPRTRGQGEPHRIGEPCWCVPLMVPDSRGWPKGRPRKQNIGTGTVPDSRDVEAGGIRVRSGAKIP